MTKPNDKEFARFRLYIDVMYELNGASKLELKHLLGKIPMFAAGEGMFSGYTEAEVDSWEADIVELPEPPPHGRSKNPLVFTEGPWEATPLLTPDQDDDPMGVYKVEPVHTALTERYFKAEPEEPEGADALSQVHTENAGNAALIEAAPAMYRALSAIVARINGVWDDPYLMEFGYLFPDAKEDILRFAEETLVNIRRPDPIKF